MKQQINEINCNLFSNLSANEQKQFEFIRIIKITDVAIEVNEREKVLCVCNGN